METFDCLALDTPLLGPHFIEASAGTGKTFAIEHIAARLLMSENPAMELEQILIVTFTRAATRELKLRIRSNLERILSKLNSGDVSWPYLSPLMHSKTAIRKISEALATFDRAQIFTIHSFCLKMLQEFSFEATIGAQVQEANGTVDALIQDFFESDYLKTFVCPEQLGIAIRNSGSIEELIRKIKKTRGGLPLRFDDLLAQFRSALQRWNSAVDSKLLLDDFLSLKGCFKAEVKGRFEEQVAALAESWVDSESGFRKLIAERGSILLYLSAENRKVRATMPAQLHYCGFFDWAIRELYPLISAAAKAENVLNTLCAAWTLVADKMAAEEFAFGPDQILTAMRKAIEIGPFKEAVQKKFRAALIDEFQDTDPDQWEIFRNLFLDKTDAFFLVGDPKQSIYRFRKADLYTYLKAKDAIDSSCHFFLDTNFRSSKELIGALNRLFDREWLRLPQENRVLPYTPVRAGLNLENSFSDGKGAVHCFQYDGADPALAYRFIANEIIQLKSEFPSFGAFSVLVRDRYSGRELQKFLLEAGIPSIAKSQELLSESLAFEAVEELFAALEDPKNKGKAKAVFAGPLGGLTAEEVGKIDANPFPILREELDSKGLTVFLSQLLEVVFGRRTVREEAASRGIEFYSELHQVFEALFAWELLEGFSIDGAVRYLESLRKMDPDDALKMWRSNDLDAVQVMTMHVSKGLEFEVVFAIGLASRTPASDEEANAEKLRQLYVAMTRAKKRLYIPIPEYAKEGAEGTHSAIELFCRSFPFEEIEKIQGEISLTIETILSGKEPLRLEAQVQTLLSPPPPLSQKSPSSYLLSFSSIANAQGHEQLDSLPSVDEFFTIHNLPRGAETGVAIHTIFERYFMQRPLDPGQIVADVLSGGPLAAWEQAVSEMVRKTVELQLPIGIRLSDLNPKKVLVEAEFFYRYGNDSMKGFIDLIFEHEKRLYIVDWKTNWLGGDTSCYTEEAMKNSMQAHQYDLQAKIYKEALVEEGIYGGAFYIYVRGPQSIWEK